MSQALTPRPEASGQNAVRSTLTKRPRRERDDDQFAGFARRIIRRLGRRVAGGNVEGLRLLLDLAEELSRIIQQAVAGLRAEGFSWEAVARPAGITRQTAWERWGKAV